ncbi:MAG: molecular chaperone HtpG [Bacilli bacterium]|nr:molecular chaperone HtpG [Bacilli bacterium]
MKKQFKAESKKLLDMMINSIYTNKEIFLRELISNASDALDKLYYLSLTDKDIKINKKDLEINIYLDKDNKTITIKDNGIGMNKEELEDNLGTIAKSGSELFKESNDLKKNIDIIGQFGVGFYSAFMVAKKVTVKSMSLDNMAYIWESDGADGYTIKETKKDGIGTEITLYLKDDDNDTYTDLLDETKISNLVKKYSDYVHYPIKMKMDDEVKTLNSMIPIWKKSKSSVKDSEYNDFYTDKFYDYEAPLKVIRSEVEGKCSYTALLFIPSHAPFNYYSKEYEKGLFLYSKGVMIMEKCADIIPDYFSFVKGLVDSEDISLNISRETLQENYQIELIAKNIESKIKKELESMLQNERETYEKFYDNFGMQLKYGIYTSYGMKKDVLKDLLLFKSSKEKKYVTFKEYIDNLKDNQDKIYYACGETIDKIDMLPQVEAVKDKGYEILYLTDNVDEFVLKIMMNYDDKTFVNVCDDDLDLDTKEEKEVLEKENEKNKDMFAKMNEILAGVSSVKYTNRLKNHPVCLTTKGELSAQMEKTLNAIPNSPSVKAEVVMEINVDHPIAKKLEKLYKKDKKEFEDMTKILYAEARLVEGLEIDNPTEITNLICDFLAK